jgi:hypothetical protein
MTQDPTRLRSVQGSPELTEVLRAAREQLPSASALERMRASLEVAVGVPLAAPSPQPPLSNAATVPAGTAAGAPVASAAWPLAVKLGLSAMALAGGTVVSAHFVSKPAVFVAPLAVSAPKSEPAQSAPALEALPAALPAIPAASAPPARPSVSARVMPAPGALGSSAQSEIPSELDLVGGAGRVLKSDPARALALASQHQKLYPAGALSEEREVIAIEALAHLGSLPAARARAEHFMVSFPRSAHLHRVEQAAALDANNLDAGTQKKSASPALGE